MGPPSFSPRTGLFQMSSWEGYALIFRKEPAHSGILTTASDLLFTGGRLHAHGAQPAGTL